MAKLKSRGTSKSAASRHLVSQTSKKLEEYLSRRLEEFELAALMVDGLEMAGHTVVVSLGITIDGKKVPLGIWLGSTENSRVCTAMLQDLLERGCASRSRFSVWVDGGKGIRKALDDVLGDGGDTWTDITRNPGLPQGVVGKIGISVSPARPSRVWAIIEAHQGPLFRSDDSGATWQLIADRRDFRRNASSYMHVIADTQDPDTVYVQSYSFWRSTDAGATFTSLAHAPRRPSLDVDRSEKLQPDDRRQRRRRNRDAERRRLVVDDIQSADGLPVQSRHRRSVPLSDLRHPER